MTPTPQHLFAILLNEGNMESMYGLKYYYKKHFSHDEEGVQWLQPALTLLLRADVVIEFDIEGDGDLDSAMFDHKDHGNIEFDDLTVIGLETKYGLGPAAIEFAMTNCDELAGLAISHGFSRALNHIRNLPIDSSKWTGAPVSFRFTDEVKIKLVRMLDEAEASLSKSSYSNSEISQGIAYLKCAKILCEAPEPPKDDIWSLLNKASTITSIASLFAPILALFGK